MPEQLLTGLTYGGSQRDWTEGYTAIKASGTLCCQCNLESHKQLNQLILGYIRLTSNTLQRTGPKEELLHTGTQPLVKARMHQASEQVPCPPAL